MEPVDGALDGPTADAEPVLVLATPVRFLRLMHTPSNQRFAEPIRNLSHGAARHLAGAHVLLADLHSTRRLFRIGESVARPARSAVQDRPAKSRFRDFFGFFDGRLAGADSTIGRPLMMSKAASVLQFVALAVATVGWCLPVVAGEIYVADGSTVGAYPTSGATAQNTLVSNLTNNVGNNPVGVAVSGNDLFVLSSGDLLGGGQFGAYNATTGATINASLPVDLSTALGIAASGGNLLVANTFGDKIGEYTTSGATVNASLVTGLKNPTVMAVSGNDLFVANAGTTGNGTEFTPRSGSIGEYNATTGAVIQKTLVTGLTSNGNNYPVGIAVSGGNLFVTNLNTVAEYNASTGALESSSLLPGVVAPSGIAASQGNLYVVDAAQSTIGEYTTSGIAVNSSLITGLGSPSAIAVVPEPSSCGLLTIGAAALLIFRRRAMIG